MRQIVVDTETTGIRTEEGHRIIEIGCIELVNRKFTGKRYHQYINPQRSIEEAAQAIHGITQNFLQDKPTFIEIAQDVIDFLTGAELIIHNAPFDVGFINYELSLTKQGFKPLTDYCRIVDTLVLARQLYMGQRNNLDALCKRYGIDNTQRELHGALLDAHLLAQVYLAMTGGQGRLFDDMDRAEINPVNPHTATVLEAHPTQKRHLPVIFADQTECAAHEAKLQKMAEKGACLWLKKIS